MGRNLAFLHEPVLHGLSQFFDQVRRAVDNKRQQLEQAQRDIWSWLQVLGWHLSIPRTDTDQAGLEVLCVVVC